VTTAAATPAGTMAETVTTDSSSGCWECGGPCLTYKGSEHGWRCRACCAAYVAAGAAAGAAREAQGRAARLTKLRNGIDSERRRVRGAAPRGSRVQGLPRRSDPQTAAASVVAAVARLWAAPPPRRPRRLRIHESVRSTTADE
jgi:hypothetical protein